MMDRHQVPMILVSAGFFQMYSKPNMVKTYLSSFYIDQHEVTNAQYKECVDTKACVPPFFDQADPKFTNVEHYEDREYDNFPVVLVSWNMADSYCRWRDKNAHLPTNAEWEKAARGPFVNQPYPWGDELPSCDEGSQNGANFSLCGSNDAFPVMQFLPNGYGLFDMAGNVGEWVNNLADPSGASYIIRGGSWLSSSSQLKFESVSFSADAIHGFVDTGFRCARDANP
jgi:formylglycine-generating enzyme required for sulfatase activity